VAEGFQTNAVLQSVIIETYYPLTYGISILIIQKKIRKNLISDFFVSLSNIYCALFFGWFHLNGLGELDGFISVNHSSRYAQVVEWNFIATSWFRNFQTIEFSGRLC